MITTRHGSWAAFYAYSMIAEDALKNTRAVEQLRVNAKPEAKHDAEQNKEPKMTTLEKIANAIAFADGWREPFDMHPLQRAVYDKRASAALAVVFPADDGEHHFGKDCPIGKVQIEFVGVNPNLRRSAYSWVPSDNAFLEVYVDGDRYRIDVGNYESAHGGTRRGLHVNCPFDVQIDKHSLNAFDVFRNAARTEAEPK